MAPAAATFRNEALRIAAATNELCICGGMLQPTTWRLNRSSTTAGHNQCSSDAMQVMSSVQTGSGALAVKLRCSRFAAMGRSRQLWVAKANFLLPLAAMPCS